MNGIPSFVKCGRRRLLQIEKRIGSMIEELERDMRAPLSDLKDRYQELDDAFCEYDRLAAALMACEVLTEVEAASYSGSRRAGS
jgi:hypothetical protein